jgi:hypothetical protein
MIFLIDQSEILVESSIFSAVYDLDNNYKKKNSLVKHNNIHVLNTRILFTLSKSNDIEIYSSTFDNLQLYKLLLTSLNHCSSFCVSPDERVIVIIGLLENDDNNVIMTLLNFKNFQKILDKKILIFSNGFCKGYFYFCFNI